MNLLVFICFCLSLNNQYSDSIYTQNRRFPHNIVKYRQFPLTVRSSRLEIWNTASDQGDEGESIQDAFRRAKEVDAEWLDETLGGSLMDMIESEAPALLQEDPSAANLKGIYRNSIVSSINEPSSVSESIEDSLESNSDSESQSESTLEQSAELDSGVETTQSDDQSDSQKQPSKESLSPEQEGLLTLGYGREEALLLRPSVQRILLEKRITRPRRGLPPEWLLASAPESVPPSKSRGRADSPGRETQTVSGMAAGGRMRRDSEQTTSRIANQPRSTNSRPRPVEPASTASRDDRVRSTAASSASPRYSTRSRDDDSRTRPINPPISTRSPNLKPNPASSPSTDDVDESVSLFWPDREEFKDLLLEESRWRAKVGGDWLLPGIKQEAKWRYFLYKKWKDFLDRGTSYGFESVDMPTFSDGDGNGNGARRARGLYDDDEDYEEDYMDEEEENDYDNNNDENDDNDDYDDEEGNNQPYDRPVTVAKSVQTPAEPSRRENVRRESSVPRRVSSSSSSSPPSSTPQPPPERVRSVDRDSSRNDSADFDRRGSRAQAEYQSAPPRRDIPDSVSTSRPRPTEPRQQQQQRQIKRRRLVSSSGPRLTWEEKRERGYDRWLQAELTGSEEQWTDLSQEQLDLIREKRRARSLEIRNTGGVGLDIGSGDGGRRGGRRGPARLSKEEWFADLDREDEDDEDDDGYDDGYDYYIDDDDDDYDSQFDGRDEDDGYDDDYRYESVPRIAADPVRRTDRKPAVSRPTQSSQSPRNDSGSDRQTRNILDRGGAYLQSTRDDTVTRTVRTGTSDPRVRDSGPCFSDNNPDPDGDDEGDSFSGVTAPDVDSGGGEDMSEEEENIQRVNQLLEEDSAFDSGPNTNIYASTTPYDDDEYLPEKSDNYYNSRQPEDQAQYADTEDIEAEPAFPSNFESEQIRRRQRQKQRQLQEQEAFRRAWEASAARRPVDGDEFSYGTVPLTPRRRPSKPLS